MTTSQFIDFQKVPKQIFPLYRSTFCSRYYCEKTKRKQKENFCSSSMMTTMMLMMIVVKEEVEKEFSFVLMNEDVKYG